MFRAVGQSSPAKRGLQKESLAVMTRVIQAFNHVTPCVITEEKIKRSLEIWKEKILYFLDSTEILGNITTRKKNNNKINL